jgi:hypothetical protein
LRVFVEIIVLIKFNFFDEIFFMFFNYVFVMVVWGDN